MRIVGAAFLLCFALSSVGFGTLERSFRETGRGAIQNVRLVMPAGYRLHQDAVDADVIVLGFTNDTNHLNFFVRRELALDMKSIFVNGSQIVRDVHTEPRGMFNWNVMQTRKNGTTPVHVTAFWMEYLGSTYYGYTAAASEGAADTVAMAFLDNFQKIATRDGERAARSLSGYDYSGKKYYFGWGAARGGDPQSMHNEVKYDVTHTHDVFTKEWGGAYLGTTLVGSGTATGNQIRSAWQRLAAQMTADDMYVQYSGGHGDPTGLEVGVSYNEIRDNALSYPAKEIIVYIMACRSGGLVNAFDQKKSIWGNWRAEGRSLFVMASSSVSQDSATGPGTDAGEPGGPSGSAGSAFGHALWKSLIGYADGETDGVKDGYLSLGEIERFTTRRTKEIGGHAPVKTGTYNPTLIMNRVPPKAVVDAIEGSSRSLTDDELAEKFLALDEAFRVHRQ